MTTGDHRLELIKKGDVRDALRSAVSDLPDAPCYIILCLDADDIDKWYARLEAGFVAGNLLMQGSAIGVGCWFTTEVSDEEIKSTLWFVGTLNHVSGWRYEVCSTPYTSLNDPLCL